jgi:hypothetical protein
MVCVALLLVACPRPSPSSAVPAAAAADLPVLGGALSDFLRVELPDGARADVEPDRRLADCETSRVQWFTLGGKRYRLVEGRMARTASASEFAPLIKRVILAAEDDLAAASPRFASLTMAGPGMLGMLVTGSEPIEYKGWLLVGIAYLRLPAGEVFSLELFEAGRVDGGWAQTDVLRAIASSASPGTRAPTVGPGIYRLPPFQINLPPGYILQCNVGPDFNVYNIQKLQGLQEAAQGHILFYLGGFPQPQNPVEPKDRPEWAKGLREKDEILGKPIAWRVLAADSVIESVHLGTEVDTAADEKADIRLVCSSAEECSGYQGIVESLALISPTPGGGAAR